MKKPYLITTAIPYANGTLHVGHSYEIIVADALARFKRLDGFDVFFLTGSDEHGLKIARSAEKAGIKPKEFVDNIVNGFKETYKKLDISYDKFIRTTDKEHIDAVQKIVEKLEKDGHIYKDTYKGYYCVPCEAFYTEFQAPDHICPSCSRGLELTEEESYFFKMSAFQNFLQEHLIKNPDFVTPEARKNEMVKNFINPGLEDLSISRTTFDWGIKLPFDNKHVLYVWLDALSNYITALGYMSEDDSLLKKYWPADLQIVGRDITRFHITIWPTILKALDLPLPKHIHSHGFVTLNGDKMSKSMSNGYNPSVLCDLYGSDATRYYFLKSGPLSFDTNYENEIFLNTINTDLVNDLGNLVSRSTAMIEQYFEGLVPAPSTFADSDNTMIKNAENIIGDLREHIKTNRVDLSLVRIFETIRMANKFIEDNQPWQLNKTDKVRLSSVMYVLYETIRIVTVALQPFLTKLPVQIFEKLGIFEEELKTFASIELFNTNLAGKKVVKGEALYKRLDINKEIAVLNNSELSNKIKESVNPAFKSDKEKMDNNIEEVKEVEEVKEELVAIDDFFKYKLKTGTIVNSEKVEKSDKLLKNTVDMGDKLVTIVSGVALHFSPEELIGKQVLLVSNLKPIKLRGIESQGMILFAIGSDDKMTIVGPSSLVPNGTEVA